VEAGTMGMNRGWVSPAVPFGAIGLQNYALCFWSAHAALFSWLFRFAASALGYAVGQWIGNNMDGATLAALSSGEQVPTVVRTLARYYPDYACGVVGAFLGALGAEAVLWRGSRFSPLGEASVCLCIVYLVFLPWFRIPIFVYPHPAAGQALVPPVTT
jgi:hypothetical protein